MQSKCRCIHGELKEDSLAAFAPEDMEARKTKRRKHALRSPVEFCDRCAEGMRRVQGIAILQDVSGEPHAMSASGQVRAEAQSHIQSGRFARSILTARNACLKAKTTEPDEIIPGPCSVVSAVRINQEGQFPLIKIVYIIRFRVPPAHDGLGIRVGHRSELDGMIGTWIITGHETSFTTASFQYTLHIEFRFDLPFVSEMCIISPASMHNEHLYRGLQ